VSSRMFRIGMVVVLLETWLALIRSRGGGAFLLPGAAAKFEHTNAPSRRYSHWMDVLALFFLLSNIVMLVVLVGLVAGVRIIELLS
jgi:hypothetical protein